MEAATPAEQSTMQALRATVPVAPAVCSAKQSAEQAMRAKAPAEPAAERSAQQQSTEPGPQAIAPATLAVCSA